MLSASQRETLVEQCCAPSRPLPDEEAHKAWLRGLHDAALVDRHRLLHGVSTRPQEAGSRFVLPPARAVSLSRAGGVR